MTTNAAVRVLLWEAADRCAEPDGLGAAARRSGRTAPGRQMVTTVWITPQVSTARVSWPGWRCIPRRILASFGGQRGGGRLELRTQVEHLRLPPPPPSRLWSVPGAGEGALQFLHDGVGAVEGVLVHAAEGVDQLAVGAV